MKFEKLITSEGWPLLQQWLEEQALEQQARATHANTWEENRMAVGSMNVYAQLADFESQLINTFAQFAQENALFRTEQAETDEVAFE